MNDGGPPIVEDPWPLALALSRLVGSQLGLATLLVTLASGLVGSVPWSALFGRAVVFALIGALVGKGLGFMIGWVLARPTPDSVDGEAAS